MSYARRSQLIFANLISAFWPSALATQIPRRVREEEDPTKSEIVIRVAVHGGPRRCNGARLIRPPAANNILIWRPLVVRSLLLPSLSRLRRFFFLFFLIMPLVRSLTLGLLRASTEGDCLPAASYTHLCSSSTRFHAPRYDALRHAYLRLLYGPTRAPLTCAPNFRGPGRKFVLFLLY